MITLPAGLVPYLRDCVAAEIAEIRGSGNNARGAETLADVGIPLDLTLALLEALGSPGSESDVTLDTQSARTIRKAVATAKSVEYARLNEFDSLDRSRKRSRERLEVLKRLSDLRRLEAAIDREPDVTARSAPRGPPGTT